MSELMPSQPSAMRTYPLSNRQVARATRAERLRQGRELARIEVEAELQAFRVQAVGYVGKQAMHEVAMVSQLEQQLAELVPLATTRLQAIGDAVALAQAQVVTATYQKVQ